MALRWESRVRAAERVRFEATVSGRILAAVGLSGLWTQRIRFGKQRLFFLAWRSPAEAQARRRRPRRCMVAHRGRDRGRACRGRRAPWLAAAHRLAEREAVGLDAGIEELDLECAVGDRAGLADQLVEALLASPRRGRPRRRRGRAPLRAARRRAARGTGRLAARSPGPSRGGRRGRGSGTTIRPSARPSTAAPGVIVQSPVERPLVERASGSVSPGPSAVAKFWPCGVPR